MVLCSIQAPGLLSGLYDARTGEILWEFDPEVPRSGAATLAAMWSIRGVAAWEGKIFVGTIDGRLIALNAGDGTIAWSVKTTPPDKPYTITGAPGSWMER